MRAESLALVELAKLLQADSYHFVTVTPETHQRVNARASAHGPLVAKGLREVFGWNWPFQSDLLPTPMFDCLVAADAVDALGGGVYRSRVRYSTLGQKLYVHSAYPTVDADAVFFGPDTYRFANLLARWVTRARRAVDIGCGTGAGLLSVADRVEHLTLADLNPRALQYSEVNALGRASEIVESDILADVRGQFDLVVTNPPYMHDDASRLYRDGGAAIGTGLSVRIVQEALQRLDAGGTLIVYTGAPIRDGIDLFHEAVRPLLEGLRADIAYEMLDPDVFGEELTTAAYADVERIAVVGLKVCLSN